MTDLEITRRCAEAMGYSEHDDSEYEFIDGIPPPGLCVLDKKAPPIRRVFYYDPLHDDAQAMALVKKLKLHIGYDTFNNGWRCLAQDSQTQARSPELNRAVCLTVAKMMENG